MSISETIAKFKENERALEDHAKQASVEKAQEAAATEWRRLGNAREVQSHLLNVVLPVLSKAALEIVGNGYVSTVQKIEESSPQKENRFLLCLQLKAASDPEKLPAVLQYRGNSSSITIQRMEIPQYPLTSIAISDILDWEVGALPLSQFTPAAVQQQVEEFVSRVFSGPLPKVSN